jgi:hypothetical protein
MKQMLQLIGVVRIALTLVVLLLGGGVMLLIGWLPLRIGGHFIRGGSHLPPC